MGIDYRFLIQLFLRRLPVVVLVALPIIAATVWFAMSLPPRFQAQSQLLVESPQMPANLAESTLRTPPQEVLGTIRQRILARENMLDMSREFGLHNNRPGLSPDAIVADMRRRITITNLGSRQASGTIRVAFEAGQPQVAAAVANAVVDQILRQNVALRTGAATQTLAFFDEEMARLGEELERQTERILTFREANQNALPDSLNFRRTRQTAQGERLLQIDRELSNLRDRRERMVATFERTGRAPGSEAASTPEQRELQQLRRELSRATVIFTPGNPRLRALQAQVAALESVVAEQMGADGEGMGEATLFDLQVADLDAQIDFLGSQRTLVEEELEALAASIDATPAIASQLSAMERDYSNLQDQYNSAVSRRAQARIGERIEAQARGQRITVLEQAVAPGSPNKPNRRAIAMAGAGGGLGLGVLIAVLLILSNRAILRPVEITYGTGMAPFGTVPLFRTRREVYARRGALLGAAVLLLVAAPAAMWWIDQHYMPLDIVIARIIDVTGLGGLQGMLRDTAS